MILTRTTTEVPEKIKHLLKKYKLGVVFLTDKAFSYMLECWGIHPDTIGTALMYSNTIFINTGRMRKEGYSQVELNYILLHEIAHVGRSYWGEKRAHACALRFARYYDIEVDYERVIL